MKNSLSKQEVFSSNPPELNEFDDFIKYHHRVQQDAEMLKKMEEAVTACRVLASSVEREDFILANLIKELKLSSELIMYASQLAKVISEFTRTY